MKLSVVQEYIRAQLLSSPTLSAFGDPLVFSYETDESYFKSIIDERLSTVGVCIDIGQVNGSQISELHPGIGSKLRGQVEVFVSEKIASPTHSPRGLALVEAVAAAIITGRYNVEWEGHETAITENGYALHVLSFSTPVTVLK
jgi:hypothetical protein